MKFHFNYPNTLNVLLPKILVFNKILVIKNRGFVEFVQNPIKRTEIHPAVYMALKMAQHRIPLQLNIHPVEEIEQLTQGQHSTNLRNPR